MTKFDSKFQRAATPVRLFDQTGFPSFAGLFTRVGTD